jgi:hypothetical protein
LKIEKKYYLLHVEGAAMPGECQATPKSKLLSSHGQVLPNAVQRTAGFNQGKRLRPAFYQILSNYAYDNVKNKLTSYRYLLDVIFNKLEMKLIGFFISTSAPLFLPLVSTDTKSLCG